MKKVTKVFTQALSKKDKRNFFAIVLAQSATSILDVIGILLVGLISALTVNLVLESNQNSSFSKIITRLNLEIYPTRNIIFILSFLTLIFFVSKSILSIFINQKVFLYYGKRQADFSSNLFSKFLNSPYFWVKKQNYERLHAAVAVGVDAIFVRVLGNMVMVLSDSILLIFVLLFLIIFNPLVSFFTFLYLAIFATILNSLIGKKAILYGNINSKNSQLSHRFLNIAFSSFKDLFVMSKTGKLKIEFEEAELAKSNSSAKGLWIQQLPKYIFEIAFTIGIFLLSFFLLISTIDNISVLMVFLVSSSRIVPAIFRIQSGLLGIKLGYAHALIALKLVSDLKVRNDLNDEESYYSLQFPPKIEIESMYFRHDDSNDYLLENISLSIEPGEIIAIVGESGTGKTTLVDLILNLYKPTKGNIKITEKLQKIIPGRSFGIGYVPQSPLIFSGTLLSNITFDLNSDEFNDSKLKNAIKLANLQDLISKLPYGLQTELNNSGGYISGGEKQRIALARALYIQPKLLVIDEGTSSLDYASENLISESIMSLRGEVTTIIIAHRLTTVKKVDKIYFLDSGMIIGQGNFFELKKLLPKFSLWVDMMNSESQSSE